MSTRAQNPFSTLLQDVSSTPPRKVTELRGLTFERNIFKTFGPLLISPLFFLIMPLAFLSDPQIQAQLHAHKTARGVVRKVSQQAMSGAGGVSTRVDYSFRAPSGATYYGASSVRPDEPFATLKPGAPLPISYVDGKPEISGISGVFGRDAFPLPMLFLFPLFALLFFAPFFLASQMPMLRARSIFRRGLLAVGRVRFVTRQNTMSPLNAIKAGYEIFYDFTDASGKEWHGSQSCNNEWLLNQLDVGSEITIAYLEKQPRKNIFLEAFLA